MDAEGIRKICRLLRRGGCVSVHIGGGEPFLDFEGLLRVIGELRRAGIRTEYAETNAYWAGGGDAAERLKRLGESGLDTLCISLDPFHAEYVPYGAPLHLARLCEETGMGYFLWKEEFLRSLSRLEPDKPHSRAEIEQSLGPDYIAAAAGAYGIQMGGRAVNIEGEYRPLMPAETLVDHAPCRGLLSAGHFHVDREGFFIPPGCTGIRLPLEEVVDGIPGGKYPVFEALYQGGIGALWDLARRCGFVPGPGGYPSKCGLCFRLRHYLASRDFAELDGNHYRESLKYY
jgi:hypothetical protein